MYIHSINVHVYYNIPRTISQLQVFQSNVWALFRRALKLSQDGLG